MLIRSSMTFPVARPRPAAARPAEPSQPSFGETALRSTIIGASLGTVIGERMGQSALIGSAGYLGWKVGQSIHPVVGAAGAVVGSGAAFFLERKTALGGTIGAASGFLTGGLIGGVVGSVIGGTQAIANSNLFQ